VVASDRYFGITGKSVSFPLIVQNQQTVKIDPTAKIQVDPIKLFTPLSGIIDTTGRNVSIVKSDLIVNTLRTPPPLSE
jgi:hypothetical protein